jgi:Tol biopolymer transport system component
MRSRPRRGAISLSLAGVAALVLAPAALGATPGQNGLILFGADQTGSSQLYTVRQSGHGLRQITHVAGDAVHPDWSPNGRKIVFELDSATGCRIVLMNANGSDQTMLPQPPGAECDEQPTFTPNGRWIVFSSFNPVANEEAIWIENLRGRHQRRLTTSPFGGATDPSVSPDGNFITFVAFNNKDLGQGLIRTGIGGRHPKLLLPYSTDVAVKHDWAPDGGRIVFTNNADNFERSANIATIMPNGTGLRFLTHFRDPEMRAYAGSYSPDGHWIVFRLENHGKFALMRMRPDGSHRHAILPLSDFRPRFIDWGPLSMPAAAHR